MVTYDVRKVFGEYQDKLELLCDGDEAARILTMRAARQGIYRLYTRKSVVKAVYNKQLKPVVSVGLKSYYLIEDVENMPIQPERARASQSVEELQKDVEKLQTKINQLAADGASFEKVMRTRERMEKVQRTLALAQEAQRIANGYWKEQAKAAKRIRRRQGRQEPPPQVSSL